MDLDKYLEAIQTDESIFPVDQFSTKNSPPSSSSGAPIDSAKKRKHKIKNIFPENTQPHKKRIMIDFDATIHQYSKRWHDGTPYDPPFEGSRDALRFLKSIGFEIVIFSTRFSEKENKDSENQKSMVAEWMSEYDIPYDRMTAEKLAAEFYVDDRAVRIENGNWDPVISFIKGKLGLLEEL